MALLATDVENLTIRGVSVWPSRDGFDIVNCRRVLVEDSAVRQGTDDQIVLKSDFSLGRRLECSDITVRRCVVEARGKYVSGMRSGCNALNIGSETVGDIHRVLWQDIEV